MACIVDQACHDNITRYYMAVSLPKYVNNVKQNIFEIMMWEACPVNEQDERVKNVEDI